MKYEQIHGIMGCIDPDLIEAADVVKKRRMPRKLRTVLIAACLCAALAAAACAAEFMGGAFLGEIVSLKGKDGVFYDGIEVVVVGQKVFSLDQFGETFLLALDENRKNSEEEGIKRPIGAYSSYTSAAEQIGLTFAENNLLKDENIIRCRVFDHGKGRISLQTCYKLADEEVWVCTLFSVDGDDVLPWELVAAWGENEEIVRSETYRMPDGSNALLIETQQILKGMLSCNYYSCSLKNGIVYLIGQLNVSEQSEGRWEKQKEFLHGFS